mmetsp:Transcript_117966/g.367521  ORF Transcript_117966/g.367521 Transcript_117966/m.367521 type:complete len:201 (-) Transcript_117966:1062-1664(-)
MTRPGWGPTGAAAKKTSSTNQEPKPGCQFSNSPLLARSLPGLWPPGARPLPLFRRIVLLPPSIQPTVLPGLLPRSHHPLHAQVQQEVYQHERDASGDAGQVQFDQVVAQTADAVEAGHAHLEAQPPPGKVREGRGPSLGTGEVAAGGVTAAEPHDVGRVRPAGGPPLGALALHQQLALLHYSLQLRRENGEVGVVHVGHG